MIPFTLYKFMSAQHAKDSIVKRRIKLSTISDLNDPFEWVPNFVDHIGAPIFPAEHVRSVMQGAINRKHGLICMSKVVTDPLLWSHYGDKHKGMALAFTFPPDSGIIEVTYSHDRVAINLAGHCDPGEKLSAAFECLLGQKYEGWKYEQECRFVVSINPATIEDGLCWKQLTGEFFSGVILGCCCPDRETDIQTLLTSQGFENATVTRVRMHPQQFAMVLQPSVGVRGGGAKGDN